MASDFAYRVYGCDHSLLCEVFCLPEKGSEVKLGKMRMNIDKESIRMKKFEYKCVYIFGGAESTSRTLNEYGQQGWELVCVWWAWHYLKREI